MPDELRRILVIGSDGSFAEDSQPLARMSVFCIAKSGSEFVARHAPAAADAWRSSTSRRRRLAGALRRQKRRGRRSFSWMRIEAPAGEMEVVLGPGWPGILLHEAIGHGLEADFNRKKTSAFSGMMGRRVASDKCTVVDNGTMPGRRGSLNVDDEGNPTGEHGADRERNPEGLSHRQAVGAADGHVRTPATGGARAISTFPCRA